MLFRSIGFFIVSIFFLASCLNSVPFLGAKNNPIKNPIITPKVKVSKLKEDLSEEKMEIKEEDIVVSRTFDNEEGENK